MALIHSVLFSCYTVKTEVIHASVNVKVPSALSTPQVLGKHDKRILAFLIMK